MTHIEKGSLHIEAYKDVPPYEVVKIDSYNNFITRFIFRTLLNRAVDVQIGDETFCINIDDAKTKLNKFLNPDIQDNSALIKLAIQNCLNSQKNKKEIKPEEASSKLESVLKRANDVSKDEKTIKDANLQSPTTLKPDYISTSNNSFVHASNRADTHSVFAENSSHGCDYYAVFNEERKESDLAAYFLKKYLIPNLKSKLFTTTNDPSSLSDEAIMNAFRDAFDQINQSMTKDFLDTGSTALVCVKIGKNLWTANVGDSRAVLLTNSEPIALSEDQKIAFPQDLSLEMFQKSERSSKGPFQTTARALTRGAQIDTLTSKTKSLQNTLTSSVPRLFGFSNTPGLTAKPIITKYPLSNNPRLIMATRGFWDVASTNDVARLAAQNPSSLSEKLATQAKNAPIKENFIVAVINL